MLPGRKSGVEKRLLIEKPPGKTTIWTAPAMVKMIGVSVKRSQPAAALPRGMFGKGLGTTPSPRQL
jgi:hypothetical protein